jgi:hypothetical protein
MLDALKRRNKQQYVAKRARLAPKKPAHVPTAFERYLHGDSTYLNQLAGFNRSQADFLADQNLDRSQYNSQFANTRRDLNLAKTESTRDIKDEYAGRGLLRSGIFNNAFGEMNRKFTNQNTDLLGQRTQFMTRLQRELAKFRSEQAIAKQQAVADAARRRAEKLGL